MKKNLIKDLPLLIILIFIVLLFKENTLFKNCILSGCTIFFHQVFPTLFPMFIINDLLIEYNFIYYLQKIFYKFFHKIFSFSNAATYIFLMSMLSGTPTNAYITTNLVKNKNLNKKDASIILTYSFFLNPLFTYNMLNIFLKDSTIVLKYIFFIYLSNFLIAFYFRKYNYQNIQLEKKASSKNFSKLLSQSIEHAFNTLIQILGTMIFYFILCEGINIFCKSPLLNCFINGLLEVTGGLSKISNLSINIFFQKILAGLFISFGGFSIHSQIKNIIQEENISSKPFFKARLWHMFLTTTWIIIAQ